MNARTLTVRDVRDLYRGLSRLYSDGKRKCYVEVFMEDSEKHQASTLGSFSFLLYGLVELRKFL